MSLELQKDGERIKARLFGALGVQLVGELYRMLTATLTADSVLELDASAVERLDTSIAQLFCYFAAKVQRLEVVRASAEWDAAVRVLGLQLLLSRESALRRNHGNENHPDG
jgi:ABC-type transporter Mla MlaB component